MKMDHYALKESSAQDQALVRLSEADPSSQSKGDIHHSLSPTATMAEYFCLLCLAKQGGGAIWGKGWNCPNGFHKQAIRMWWLALINTAFSMVWQEDCHEFEDRQGYNVRSCFTINIFTSKWQ